MQDNGGWTRQSSRYLYESGWYNLRQDQVTLPTGKEITYTLVEHPGYAVVVPLHADGAVILVNVFRYTLNETVLECPSGGLDGEPPMVAAKRELQEETGWTAATMLSLGECFGSTGISNERFEIFLATALTHTGTSYHDPTEQIELCTLPLETAVEMALSGEMKDAPSALALIRAQHYLRHHPL